MKRSINTRIALCLLVLCTLALCVSVAMAQETTAGIQGMVKDQTQAVVSNAAVEISGPALIGTKKATTDSSGFYRFSNLPPGSYSLTITAAGFKAAKRGGITLEVGRLPNVDVQLEVGANTEVVEVSGAAPLVDVSQSKVQTNVTLDILENAPSGRSYQSVIQFAPGARAEPMQGGANNGQVGYQIDGSGNSENSYLVDGQETADVQNGAANTNVPMEFIQEVVVKSSGFEAEHGGALGGVINVIQKRGSNSWHGSIFTYYEGDALDSAPNRTLRRDPTTSASLGVPYVDQTAQYVQPKKDHYRFWTPGFEAGGDLVKDRLWLFLSTVPSLERRERTVNMTALGPRTFLESNDTYYSLARLDLRASNKVRLFGSWQYNYEKGRGANFAGGAGPLTLTLPNADYAWGGLNTTAGNNPDNFNSGIGFVRPSVIYNFGGDITFNPSVVLTTRFGRVYNDYQDRGIPVGIRYFYRDTTYPYGVGNAPAPASTTSLDGHTLGVAAPGSVQTTGFSTMGDNTATLFNRFARLSYTADLSFFKRGFGSHNFKTGFGLNRLNNNTASGYNTADVYVGFGLPWSPSLSSPACGVDANGNELPCPPDQRTAPGEHCADVKAENTAMFGVVGANNTCRGNWGTVNLRELGTNGKAASMNYALYVQDAWTVGHGLSLNLGVRFDKEHVPTFVAGNPGISFGFGQKVAPRLGASWDVLQNGKFKLYGSFGYFFDIMKYELPRGSFGGDYWHDCVYAVDDPNVFTAIVPVRGSDGHYCPRTGEATGTITGARFIANEDFRLPVNDVSQGVTGLIDPNLKPMKQHELVIGADWAIRHNLALETRWSRKRLDDTIEDAGTILPNGEQYYLVNPGKGLNATKCDGCPPNPVASRRYDGLEFRLTRASSARWFGALSYTYSRLWGNYSGLTATDISDGGGGRQGSNTSRAFDEPFMSFDAHGKVIDGPEATDRPNAIKAFGYYRLKWWKMETLLGGYQVWYSGSPLTSYLSVWGAPVFVEGRGNFVNVTQDPTTGDFVLGSINSRRTPSYSQSDLSMVNELSVSKQNERLKLGFEVNFLNLFNQHSPVYFDTNLLRASSINPPLDYQLLETGNYNYIDAANGGSGYLNPHRYLNSMYGMPYGWQSPRGIRMKVKFIF